MDRLEQLEQQSVYIFREAFRVASGGSACCGRSGRNSTVLLWLARKAFFGRIPFPLVHIDTSYKLPEMIAYRSSRLAMEYKLRDDRRPKQVGAGGQGHLSREAEGPIRR